MKVTASVQRLQLGFTTTDVCRGRNCFAEYFKRDGIAFRCVFCHGRAVTHHGCGRAAETFAQNRRGAGLGAFQASGCSFPTKKLESDQGHPRADRTPVLANFFQPTITCHHVKTPQAHFWAGSAEPAHVAWIEINLYIVAYSGQQSVSNNGLWLVQVGRILGFKFFRHSIRPWLTDTTWNWRWQYISTGSKQEKNRPLSSLQVVPSWSAQFAEPPIHFGTKEALGRDLAADFAAKLHVGTSTGQTLCWIDFDGCYPKVTLFQYFAWDVPNVRVLNTKISCDKSYCLILLCFNLAGGFEHVLSSLVTW